MIKLVDRVLLNFGISIISVRNAAEYIVKNGNLPNHLKVEDSFDAKIFEQKYCESIIEKVEDTEIKIQYSDDLVYDNLTTRLAQSNRHQTGSKEHVERFSDELDYFERSGHTQFLCSLEKLIGRFREDGVVWGVGRGSSCASYILYLLEVHDIDPIKHQIPFEEFSKEEKNDEA